MAPHLREDSEEEDYVGIAAAAAGMGSFSQKTPAEHRREAHTCPPSASCVAYYKAQEMLCREMQAQTQLMTQTIVLLSTLLTYFGLDPGSLRTPPELAVAGPSHSRDEPKSANHRPPPSLGRLLNTSPQQRTDDAPETQPPFQPPRAPVASANQRAGPPPRRYSDAVAAPPPHMQIPSHAHNNKRHQQPQNARQARENNRPPQTKWSQPPYICEQPRPVDQRTRRSEQPRQRPQGQPQNRRFQPRGRNPNIPPWNKAENPAPDAPDAAFRRKYINLLEAAKKESETPQEKGNCKIVEVKGDLIKLMQEGRAKNALHLVACDMPEAGASAGIAAKLLQTFPVPKLPRGFKKEVGAVLTQPLEETDTVLHHAMYKQRSVDKIYWAPEAYLKNMDKGMDGIVDLIRSNKLNEVWMPRILSGCDRLHWSVVSRWLQDKLADCPHPITLFVVSWDGEARTAPRPPPAEPNDGWRTVTPRRRGSARSPAASPHSQRGGAGRGTQHRIAPVEPIQTRSRAASQRQQPF